MEPEIIQSNRIPPVPEAAKPKGKIWGGWPTVGFSLVIFTVYFIAQTVVAVVFVFNRLISNPGAFDTQAILELATNGDLVSIATIVSAVFGLGFIVLFIKIRKGAGLCDYLGLASIPKKAFLISAAVVVVLLLISSFLPEVWNISEDDGFTSNAYQTATWPVLLWVAVAVFAPLFEEAFFRGFLFVGLKESRLGAAWAVVFTSLFWALLHIQYSTYGIVTVLVLGIALGIIRLVTKSLWSTIILHSLWNIVAMVGTILYVNG
ncbi:MAG: CPBP family intramembrane metalloprotease [Dehalococcoidales bacterium]|nr:CPBP family intramembrane metalloprotease [Dehalococcoidales bacterium]